VTRAIFRYEIPADDQWHTVPVSGGVVHVGTRTPYGAEVWALHVEELPQVDREFRVFGTGQPLPEEPSRYVGTAIVPGGALVWHLMERV
jgi:hypothetical protein